MPDIITQEQIKKIATEAAKKEVNLSLKKLEAKIDVQGQMLEKLYRVLLGEEGLPEEETVSYKARMAHEFARSNVNVVGEVIPIIDWFDDWSKPQPGCDESYFQKVGKMVQLYDRLKWLFGILIATSVVNAVPVIERVVNLFN